MTGVSTMTIIRTSGTAPDVVVNGVVNAEIKRMRECNEYRQNALIYENNTLRRQRDALAARLSAEQKQPLKCAIKRRIVAYKDRFMIALCWPVLFAPCAYEWFLRRFRNYDDYDLGYTRERK